MLAIGSTVCTVTYVMQLPDLCRVTTDFRFPLESFLQVLYEAVLSVWMSKILTGPSDSLTVTWCCVLPQMWLTLELKCWAFSNRRSEHKTYCFFFLTRGVFCRSVLQIHSSDCHFIFFFQILWITWQFIYQQRHYCFYLVNLSSQQNVMYFL